MNLPTQEDINPIPEDLDGQCVVRNFLGKTIVDGAGPTLAIHQLSIGVNVKND